MTITIERLREQILEILGSHGVPEAEARVGAEMCVDAEMRGRRSHGVRLLRNVVTEYAAGADRRGDLRVDNETSVSARVDGGFHLSWFVHREAVDIAIRKATTHGIGLVSVRKAGVSGALGYLVERIAAAELVGVAFNSTPATVVAPGSGTPFLGTNPLAFAVPRENQPPLVLDMATSTIAFNELRRRNTLGLELPAGAVVDRDGSPTTDPTEAIDPVSGRGRILPFGGHRGFGLALMVELLVSAGVTGRAGDLKRGEVIAEPEDFGGLYLAYRADLVGDPAAAQVATSGLLADLVAAGCRLPGESSREAREAALVRGEVELDADAAAVLESLVSASASAPHERS